MDNELYEIEKRLAYLEKYVDDLNEVIIKQDKLLEALKAEVIELKEKDAQSPLQENRPHLEKPPHY